MIEYFPIESGLPADSQGFTWSEALTITLPQPVSPVGALIINYQPVAKHIEMLRFQSETLNRILSVGKKEAWSEIEAGGA